MIRLLVHFGMLALTLGCWSVLDSPFAHAEDRYVSPEGRPDNEGTRDSPWLPYTGISVGWMWNPTPTPCHHNLIENNHIHDVMQVLSDGGGIYTLGRQPGTVLKGNRIHTVPLNLGRAESNGMFLDEGTTDLVIEQNVVYDITRSPLRFHRAGDNLVRGNRLVVSPDVPPVRYDATPEENVRLEENDVRAASDIDAEEAERLLPEAGRRSRPDDEGDLP